ncbi:polyprenyl synthetase family protein [Paenibacillus sp. GP183]|uniref:polyprenyl synthetase family protein n=1 Tax=Paenibacillus sp. GP183 TaxID=1882751 RepID=UPI00089643C6|nr:polyprenyl synthetase family protein [Paenibacillus sp. GP183]SEC48117.1 competence protein ComQ [Paenibacillus sp. GP183]
MENTIIEHMHAIVDEHIDAKDLNKLIKLFIQEKSQEKSPWSTITRCTHFMLGGNSPQIDRIAAATELIMLVQDIVDDLQDQDQENKPWMQCEPAYTLNAVLAFLISFFGELELLQGNHTRRLNKEISKIISRSINGQQKDISNSIETVDDYLIMVQEKSGSIIRLACYMGYASLDVSPQTIEHIDALADYAGLIHQIQNDMNDLNEIDNKSDLFLKKCTLPILYLLESEDTSFPLLKPFYQGRIRLDELIENKEAWLTYIDKSGCIEYSKIVQSICITKAEEIYEELLAIAPWKEKFRDSTYGSFV